MAERSFVSLQLTRQAKELGETMVYQSDESPADAGRRWAEEKAERLRGEIPAVDWPVEWSRSFDRVYRLPDEVTAVEGAAYLEAAHHAATKRWLELVEQQCDAESVEEEEVEHEIVAVKLLRSVIPQLPEPLTADRDGPQVFIQDAEGLESSVTTLAQAWRVVADWDERLTR